MLLVPLLLAATLNLEVYVAFLDDQAERAGDIPDVAAVLRHDEQRRRIVQRVAVRGGALEPFDPNGVSDDERMKHAVPPLAERRHFIEELNAKGGG